MSELDYGGMHVAMVDGAAYYRVDWIVQDVSDGRWPQYYCDAAEWPTTPIGKQAALHQEIAQLQARIADLEAQIAAHAALIAVADAAPARPKRSGGIAGRVVCPTCGKKLWPNMLEAHTRKAHRQHAPAEPPPAAIETAPPAPPLAFGTWRCAICESDVFAASKHDPAICLRCVKAKQNGHAAPQLA